MLNKFLPIHIKLEFFYDTHLMQGKKFGYLTVLGFSHWESASTFWKCKCYCGRIVSIDRRRFRGKRPYKSCGCLINVNSTTYFHEARKKFFKKIYKKDDHWIYKTKGNPKEVNVRIFNKHYAPARIAYMFWNHLKTMPKNLLVSRICNEPLCVSPAHLRVLTWSESSKLKHFNRKKNGINKRLRSI